MEEKELNELNETEFNDGYNEGYNTACLVISLGLLIVSGFNILYDKHQRDKRS